MKAAETRLEGVLSILTFQAGPYAEGLRSRQNVLIHSNQQLMRLRKITVISGITLRAHFSLGIAKFDTLPNIINS